MKREQILHFLKNFTTVRFIAGVSVGAVAGFAYYYFIGCESGSCAITSNPVNSTLYGVLMGAVLGFQERKKIAQPETEAKS